MKLVKTILVLLIFTNYANGQLRTAACNCVKSKNSDSIKPDTSFRLNDKVIVLCGYTDTGTIKGEKLFSEFVLSVCGQDTIIKFWGAVKTCRVLVNKDTLLVEELKNLPVGNNAAYKQTVWTTEKIFFEKERVIRKSVVNRKIRKYGAPEIQPVLKEFETRKNIYDPHLIDLADKLFIATISGDTMAKKYFMEFSKKFTIDGADEEGYDDLKNMLGLWEAK